MHGFYIETGGFVTEDHFLNATYDSANMYLTLH